jgi:NAD(P)-dependent dehydrogenase (short-subunit alcohol dehydrogenase family)
MSVWFVTGASRGLGAQIVERALAAGHQVVATGRSASALGERFGSADTASFLPVALDVTDQASIARAIATATERFGRIDVVVNNAGYGFVGTVEETSDAEVRATMDTNFFGTLDVIRAVLPVLRAQRSGRLVAISSYGGFTQPAGAFGIYGASKFAVEAIHEALHHELADFGITVTIVEPGSLRTGFLESSSFRVSEDRIDAYAPLMRAREEYAATETGRQDGDPVKAAAAIVSFVDSGATALRLPLGQDAFAAVAAKLDQVAGDLEIARPYGGDISF